jgi:hypothetical protein
MAYKRGKHPNSLKNLEKGQFKKGEVSNPRGRPPKELCITSILRQQLGEPCPYAPGKTWAEWLARRALELAGENPTYYRELLDRVEGKVAPNAPMQLGSRIINIIVQDKETKELMERAGERTRLLVQAKPRDELMEDV